MVTFESNGVIADSVRAPLLLMVSVYAIRSPTLDAGPKPPSGE